LDSEPPGHDDADLDGGIARTFSRIVAAFPDLLALRTSEHDVTYGELAARAGGAAQRLAGGERSGPVLAIVRDAIDIAVAALAAAAVGRPVVVVPADTNEDAMLSIARSACASEVIGPPGVPKLGELPTWSGSAALGPFEPVHRSDDQVLALVGTSGSTGAPRFIGLLEERFGSAAVDSCVLNGMSPGIRVATTYSTAAAPYGIIMRTLAAGATCTVIDVRRIPSSAVLSLLSRHQVTRIRIVPSVMRSFMSDTTTPQVLEHVTAIGTIGERLSWHDVARMRSLVLPTAIVSNAYGLTETGLLTDRIINPEEPLGTGAVGIGDPVRGRSVWIDDDGGRADDGRVGEIVVEGRLGAVGITVETLPDGSQRYRTGDLGSRLPDGSFMHHGRLDRESKVAGHRVDLAAIESAFRSVPGVIDVAVLDVARPIDASHGSAGVPRVLLVAHVSARADVTAESLRSELATRLIGPAIPSRIVLHDGPLPQLPSGKLDVKALRVS
jgi:acyl-coenzyme A synthetase/AMP-(fatty) acid ligase